MVAVKKKATKKKVDDHKLLAQEVARMYEEGQIVFECDESRQVVLRLLKLNNVDAPDGLVPDETFLVTYRIDGVPMSGAGQVYDLIEESDDCIVIDGVSYDCELEGVEIVEGEF